MGIEQRRIIIGYNDTDGTPITKMLRASSQEEMNEKIVQAFIDSGRIHDFLSPTSTFYQFKGNITLIDYANDWLTRKRKLKETTRVNYRKYLIGYIFPELGDRNIGLITSADIQNLLDKHSKLAEKTLKDMKSILSQIFQYAISDGLILKNPCMSKDVDIPSSKKKLRQALPIEFYHDIIIHLPSLTGFDKRFLAICLFTAMRRGEILGLRWEDIHHGKIHIKRNVTHPQRNTPEITTPKTKAGIRAIPMIEPLLQALLPFEETGYVIGGEKPLTLSAYRAMWNRITKSIDLHGATPHILRHSYLTYAVGATTDFKTVQGISGHSDIFTLLNRYAHSQDDKVLELSSEMEKILTKMQIFVDAFNPLCHKALNTLIGTQNVDALINWEEKKRERP